MTLDKHYTYRPLDKNLSEKFDDLILDVSLYRNLQDIERRLDATFTRKRLDLQNMLTRQIKKKKTLRIFVSNTCSNQPWQVQEGNDFTPPEWTINIEGRLLDEDDDQKEVKFSSYFTSISVEFNGEVVEWMDSLIPEEAPGKSVPFDVFKVTRKGIHPTQVKIIMQLKEYPDKAKLSEPLSNLLALEEATKSEVILALWQYIKFHDLQQNEEKRNIKCDEPLRQLFGRNNVTFPEIMDLITPYLLMKEPLIINYTIDTLTDNTIGQAVYDATLEFEDPIYRDIKSLLDSWFSNQQDIFALDDQIALTVQQLNNARMKRDFFNQFASDPDFVQKWSTSQARDLKLLSGDRGFNEEEVRHSSFYTDEFLGESVHLLLSRR